MGEQESQFGKLPVEMKMMIFNNLNVEDKKCTRLVCRNWATAVNILVRFNVQLTDKTMSAVIASDVRLHKIKVINFTKGLPASSKRSDSLTEIKKLTFDASTSSTSPLGTTVENVRKLLVKCTKLEHLSFKPWSLQHLRAQGLFQGLDFLFLKQIKFVFLGDYNKNQHDAIMGFTTEGPFPNLTQVVFDMYFFKECPMNKYHSLYQSVFQFVGRHSRTLTNLFIRHPLYLSSPVGKPFILDPVEMTRMEVVKGELKKCRFTHLEIDVMRVEALELWSYGRTLISVQERLVTLCIHGKWLCPEISEAIQKSQSTLRAFNGIYLEDFRTRLDLQWFCNAQLEFLYISRSPTLNIRSLPVNTLFELVWCSKLETEELNWLSTCSKFTKLKYLTLRDYNRNMPIITLRLFINFLKSMTSLTEFWMDCRLEGELIRAYCRQPERKGLKVAYAGRISIDRTVFTVDSL